MMISETVQELPRYSADKQTNKQTHRQTNKQNHRQTNATKNNRLCYAVAAQVVTEMIDSGKDMDMTISRCFQTDDEVLMGQRHYFSKISV